MKEQILNLQREYEKVQIEIKKLEKIKNRIINDLFKQLKLNQQNTQEEKKSEKINETKSNSQIDLNSNIQIDKDIFVLLPLDESLDIINKIRKGGEISDAISIGMFQKIDVTKNSCQILILTRKKETTLNIQKTINAFKNNSKIICNISIPCGNVKKIPKRNGKIGHIEIGTVAGIVEMIKSGNIKIDNIKMLVINEPSQLLANNFISQTNGVINLLSKSCKIFFLSDIPSFNLLEKCSHIMKQSLRILIKKDQLPLKGIKQFYVQVGKDDEKLKILKVLFNVLKIDKSLVFCKNQETVDYLIENSEKVLFNNFTSENFIFDNSKALITIGSEIHFNDLPDFSLIINYDFPTTNYHLDKNMVSITLITDDDLKKSPNYEFFFR